MGDLVPEEEFEEYNVGDVITLGGKRYKVTRKGVRTMAASRYYWFDAVWDRLKKDTSDDDSHTHSEFDPQG